MFENGKYNGWSNRETWVVNLWLTNEQSLYDELRRGLKFFSDTSRQAEALEEWVREELDEQTSEAMMWRDLLTTSLGRVNWHEIVECNLE